MGKKKVNKSKKARHGNKKNKSSRKKAVNAVKQQKSSDKMNANSIKESTVVQSKKTNIKQTGKNEILLSEKINLKKTTLGCKSFLINRYGKYTPYIKKPARILLRLFLVFVLFVLGGLLAVYSKYGNDLPDVTKLKDMNFSETSFIYDREGNVLYSIFADENRKYVPLKYISPYAVDATLAIEDKNFFKHTGFDPFGILRAQLKNLQEDSIKQGASTITQQLAKNIFLSPEKTYERKIKELLISLQIEWFFTKNEILELYLNKIAYGSNAFGLEAASETFFGKSSRDISLVESAILAGLPKAPTYYSPYGQNKKELLGYCKMENNELDLLVVDSEGTAFAQEGKPDSLVEQGDSVNVQGAEVVDVVSGESDIAVDGSASDVGVVAPDLVGPVELDSGDSQGRAIITCDSPDDPDYIKGRKDFVLERMLEDGYISRDQLLTAWKEGFNVKFKDPAHKIKAPHFVFYVKEFLEKNYGTEIVQSGGLEVVTTLDPYLQALAEEQVAVQVIKNTERYDARNGAMVSIDPKTGQILAMVGSKDYWDESIDGQVNVVTSPRQPGSTFKPFIYASAIQNAGIGSGTKLTDYETLFEEDYIPKNSDDEFKGEMTVRHALSNSRNIPAIKAFYIAGGEEPILNFLDGLGIHSLRAFKDAFNATSEEKGWTFNYGPAMAIGSGEVTLLEMVSAYGTFANGGKRMALNPILEIRDREGNILEQFEPIGEQVVDPQVAFIINSILSDVEARPYGGWRTGLTIEGHTVAAKTGTSNKKVEEDVIPNNLLTIGYSPSIATGVWSGNTDGSEVKEDAWGLTGAGPIWKGFMVGALKDRPDEPFFEPPGIQWKGHEAYPSFAEYKDFDAMFKRVVEETIPESDFIATREENLRFLELLKKGMVGGNASTASNTTESKVEESDDAIGTVGATGSEVVAEPVGATTGSTDATRTDGTTLDSSGLSNEAPTGASVGALGEGIVPDIVQDNDSEVGIDPVDESKGMNEII